MKQSSYKKKLWVENLSKEVSNETIKETKGNKTMEKESNGKQCRVVKNTNFTVMSNIHLRATNLSLKAKGLMSLCLSLPESWDYSIAGLVTLSTDGRDSVTSALKELEKNYYLTIDRNKDSKGFFTSLYTFYENPKENPKHNENNSSIHNGFSVTDNPMQITRCSSSDTENPEQINTNKKIKKTNKENKEIEKNLFGEFQNVSLTSKEEEKLRELYGERFEDGVAKLSNYKMASGKKYKSDYAVLNKHNWVYKNIFPQVDNIRPINTQTQSKYSKCYG